MAPWRGVGTEAGPRAAASSLAAPYLAVSLFLVELSARKPIDSQASKASAQSPHAVAGTTSGSSIARTSSVGSPARRRRRDELQVAPALQRNQMRIGLT